MEASNNYNDLVILNDDQLRTLAEQIRYQEATVIQQTNFKTPKELLEFLANSKSSQESVLALLATGQEVVTKYQDDAVKGPIARDLHLYIVYCCNSALQTVPNYHVRKGYLQKIRDHVDVLLSVLDDLDAAEQNPVAVVANGVVQYKNAMLIYTRQFKSTLSSNFSAALKNEGVKYENLVQLYASKLGFQGHFKDLEDEQKAQVFESIIATSGRESSPIKDVMSTASKAKGIAVNVYKVGSVVWDIYSSDHKFKKETIDAIAAVVKEKGAELGEIINAALDTELLVVEAEALFVTLAGIAGGFFIREFIVGTFVGWLMDALLGTATFPSSAKGLHCYISSLPDGVALARAIAHDGTKDPNVNSTN
ncbi:uncharacterized protein LOC131151542 [Malania oleifera]|uniref:uncharacterized protein LOC131151542 n=1 Tax=Malania oleifera TaxID=397392 RepID=UPI0025AE91DA|nr:uncharacterized protein LOC131151542 [Malania oleifera]